MNEKSWSHLLYPPSNTNKYTFGHVVVIGGSQAMVGAPVLAARAALRTGAGLVTIASTAETVALINRDVEEIMTLTLPAWGETAKILETIRNFIQQHHVHVLIIGPGLPTAADKTICAIIADTQLPMVVDAESFTALSGHLATLKTAAKENENILLTPHPGEYARLVKGENNYVQEDERTSIQQFAQAYNVTLVLKHSHTLVASSTGATHQNTTGNPGLATAGSGDVLAGIIAGLLAQKTKSYEAAKMAVWLHGLAGDIAAAEKTEAGMIASDIIEAIPQALHRIAHNANTARYYPYILTIGGLLGLIAMTWQAAERVTMLKHPGAILSCNLSPILNCGSVLNDRLSAIFGFPNAFLGMIFFTILATSGLQLIATGKFSKWYRHFVMFVSLILLLFSFWFFSMSLYAIGKVCSFCIVGWVVSIPIFWYGLLYYLPTTNVGSRPKIAAMTAFGRKHHADVIIAVYVAMLILFFIRFRAYYF